MIERELACAIFTRAVARCDPARRVADALDRLELAPRGTLGLAVGKTALAMARGVGPVVRGLAITLAPDGGELPDGWRLQIASHPVPDERSLAAGEAAVALVASARPSDTVIALISGGTSALIEQPRVPLAELRALIGRVMAAGAPIAELNTVRMAMSAIKGGQLALACPGRIVTLVASDVIGDRMEVVGSGPTIGPWLASRIRPLDPARLLDDRRRDAIRVLERRGIPIPAVLRTPATAKNPRVIDRAHDRAMLVTGIGEFAKAAREELAATGLAAQGGRLALDGFVSDVADRLAARARRGKPFVAYGEPTLVVPEDHGEGGRMQQLGLELARRLRGTDRGVLVAGTDGIDGPWPRHRPAPAGAYVDGTTWDRVLAVGIDPARALARCDAGTALAAIDALFVPGPTGINHADIVIVG